MKVLGAILFFTISSNSFAGLFCESLKCDLSVTPYSDRVVSTRTETRETKITKPFTIAEIKADTESKMIPTAIKEAQQKILDNNDEASKVFNQPGVRVKSCTSEVAGETKPEIMEVPGSKDLIMQFATRLRLICTIEILDKKNNAEIAEALCQRAMQCAASVDSADKLASYVKLKDGLCGKNSDSIIPTAGIDSSGRSSKKENTSNEGGSYGSPAQTTSK